MDFGLHLPASSATVTAPELVRFAQKAEQLGFYCLTVADHVIVPKNISVPYPYTVDGKYPGTGYHLETLMTMGYLAGATKRIKMYTYTLIVPYRHCLEAPGIRGRYSGCRYHRPQHPKDVRYKY